VANATKGFVCQLPDVQRDRGAFGRNPEAVVLQGLACGKCGGQFECDPADLFNDDTDPAV
jgi:hypothetical protein